MTLRTATRISILVSTLLGIVHCGQQPVDNTPQTRNGNVTKPPVTPPANPKPNPAQIKASTDFFLAKLLPIFKASPCTNCHNDPRNLSDPKVAGPQTILEHSSMYKLLQDGTGPNNNKLINKLLAVEPHTGGKQCRDENTGACAVIKEWYKLNFGAGVASLGVIENINREGTISGWAGSADAPTVTFEVRFYLDGETGKGTALAPTMANLSANDNGLSGNHGFSTKIPADKIDGKQHALWAYAVQDGKEILLAGSPLSYAAFKPKGAAVATSFAQTRLASCQGGCHPSPSFDYSARWGTLLGDGQSGQWSATSNGLYDKISGKKGHGAGAPTLSCPGSVDCAALAAWWTQEFGP